MTFALAHRQDDAEHKADDRQRECRRPGAEDDVLLGRDSLSLFSTKGPATAAASSQGDFVSRRYVAGGGDEVRRHAAAP